MSTPIHTFVLLSGDNIWNGGQRGGDGGEGEILGKIQAAKPYSILSFLNLQASVSTLRVEETKL